MTRELAEVLFALEATKPWIQNAPATSNGGPAAVDAMLKYHNWDEERWNWLSRERVADQMVIALVDKWIAAEILCREKVDDARVAGHTSGYLEARAHQLKECRLELQEAFGLLGSGPRS